MRASQVHGEITLWILYRLRYRNQRREVQDKIDVGSSLTNDVFFADIALNQFDLLDHIRQVFSAPARKHIQNTDLGVGDNQPPYDMGSNEPCAAGDKKTSTNGLK